MRVLITGGLGFVGVNLAHGLLRGGHHVRILDNCSTGSRSILHEMLEGEGHSEAERGRVEVIEGDVTDADAVRQATREMDAVVHLAAHTDVIDSVERPEVSYEINAFGTLRVCEAARQAEISRVVVASSNAAAGEVEPPIHEEVVPRPVSPYGAGKLSAEAIASAYAGSYGIRTVSLRFANVYGPYSLHKGSVVALFLKRILREEPLVLYDEGRPTRDYIHVSDVVQAIERALDRDVAWGVYQIATGVETSVVELVEILQRVTGRRIQTQPAPPRAGEITRNFADIAKARHELAFAPEVELEAGIRRLWPWFDKTFG